MAAPHPHDDDVFIPPSDDAPPAPLTDDEAARLLSVPLAPPPQQQQPPSWAERFEALSRRGGKALSDEQAAAILAAAPVPNHLPDLPTASVSPVPHRPAIMLGYRTRHARRAGESIEAIRQLPLAFRIVRVGVWLVLAALILLVCFAGPGGL